MKTDPIIRWGSMRTEPRTSIGRLFREMALMGPIGRPRYCEECGYYCDGHSSTQESTMKKFVIAATPPGSTVILHRRVEAVSAADALKKFAKDHPLLVPIEVYELVGMVKETKSYEIQ